MSNGFVELAQSRISEIGTCPSRRLNQRPVEGTSTREEGGPVVANTIQHAWHKLH